AFQRSDQSPHLPRSRATAAIYSGSHDQRGRWRREALTEWGAAMFFRVAVLFSRWTSQSAVARLVPIGFLPSACLALSACSNHGASDNAGSPAGSSNTVKPPDLRILAGSELKDLEPDIKEAARKAGLNVQVSYSGTLDMVDRVNAGEPFDAILPPNGAYPVLALTHKPLAR